MAGGREALLVVEMSRLTWGLGLALGLRVGIGVDIGIRMRVLRGQHLRDGFGRRGRQSPLGHTRRCIAPRVARVRGRSPVGCGADDPHRIYSREPALAGRRRLQGTENWRIGTFTPHSGHRDPIGLGLPMVRGGVRVLRVDDEAAGEHRCG